nr:type III-A CRISPR-associated protein Cas10/Csm1 [Candidatus Sigynarchaeota archaeon]
MTNEDPVTFAALLHDIGKLGYRAGLAGSHEEIGANFIDEHGLPIENLRELIALHHGESVERFADTGSIPIKKIIIADWLASAERVSGGNDSIGQDVRSTGLLSVFNDIKIYGLDKSVEPRPRHFLPGKRLNLTGGAPEIFPVEEKSINGEVSKNFGATWKEFQAGFDLVKLWPGFEFEFLSSFLERHFKFIPSAAARGIKPDISLYIHSKMTCAISQVLDLHINTRFETDLEKVSFLNKVGTGILPLIKADKAAFDKALSTDPAINRVFKEEPVFELIHGDFSGIQDFIHAVTSKYAMKTLKGRSTFLALLADAVARYIAQTIDLTPMNIIYSGGGNFFILAHHFKGIKEKINEIANKINEIFFTRLKGALFLAMDAVPLTLEQYLFDILKAWTEVINKASAKKRRKFLDLIAERGNTFFAQMFEPDEKSVENDRRCVVCNSFTSLKDIEKGKSDQWCRQCEGFSILANAMKRSKGIKHGEPDKESGAYNTVLAEVKGEVSFIQQDGPRAPGCLAINDPEAKNATGFELLSMGFALDKNMNIRDLSEMAKDAEQRTGYNKIGVLKMDVDSLGKIFQVGLVEHATLSRITELSASIDLFFKGFVSMLQAEKYPDSVHVIFSGGDDMLAVGGWDMVIEFAIDVYRHFRQFTTCNPDISASAGIFIETPTFPIIYAETVAESMLQKAKESSGARGGSNPKNKICLFGRVLRWDVAPGGATGEQPGSPVQEVLSLVREGDDKATKENVARWMQNKVEFDLARILKDVLVTLITTRKFSKGLLHRIAWFTEDVGRLVAESLKGKVEIPKIWRLRYMLRDALASKVKETRCLARLLVALIEIIVYKNAFGKRDLPAAAESGNFLLVAIEWADYSTRGIQEAITKETNEETE